MHKQNLFNILSSIKPLTNPFKDYLSNKLVFHEFNKGELLAYSNPASHIFYFIGHGLVCGTKFSDDKRTVLWYSQDGNFIVPKLINPKEQYIGRLEFQTPTLLIGLELPFVNEALKTYKEAKEIFLGIIAKNNDEAYERELFLRLSPENRLLSLTQRIPMISVKTKIEYMASYMNLSTAQYLRLKKANLKPKR